MNALVRAEQAVLGAVLLDPAQLAHLDWLSPDHFHRPVHQALFAALRQLRVHGHPGATAEGPVPLSWVTDAVTEAARHVRGLTPAYPHTLIANCPRPGNAPVYGRMVLEGAIHRTVTEHAVRLHQAARADAANGEVTGALGRAEILADVLADLAHRWGSEPRPAAPGTPLPVPSSTEEATDGASSRDEERLLLAALAERPEELEPLLPWLRPEDFADPGLGELFRCMGALHHRGEAIDPLTVLWEAQHRGLISAGTVAEHHLAALDHSPGPAPAPFFAEQILAGAVARTAAMCARTVQNLAADATLAPGPLISCALRALDPLEEIHARWTTAAHRDLGTPSTSDATPPSARVDAALARTRPRPAPRSTDTGHYAHPAPLVSPSSSRSRT